MDFVKRNGPQYDLICMDIFQDRRVPKKFESASFLYALKSRLNPGGVLIFNRLAIDEEDKKSNALFYEVFHQLMPESVIQKMAYNWMFVFRKPQDNKATGE